ncbi:lipid A deacylase LpxR family protein [Halioxenophilus aromaticivorans]|uniref:Lipid A deacylase LpxR family protein n=1 Tax=Halioxenophilus aromaticivorans TaxID=1306992 RepID=A0AAV3U5E5_9ALTE
MKLKKRFVFTVLLLATSTISMSALAQGNRWLQLIWENDIIAQDDAGYTNGVAISWGRNGLASFDGQLPNWLNELIDDTEFARDPNRRRAMGYVLAQQMFTPGDIQARELIDTDRPYVGLTLWGASLYSFAERSADHWELVLGVVGPWSGAKQGQKLVHRMTGSQQPRGWDNQIHNEPVFAVRGQRLWRIHDGVVNGLQWDLVGSLGAAVGNLRSETGGLLVARLGSGLANTWAAVSSISSREVNSLGGPGLTGWQLYWSLAAGYVANDITLNGNTFRDSHSVGIEHWRAGTSVGVLQNWGPIGLSFSYQLATDEFDTQTVNTRFGTLAFTYRY